jgi:glycosyltransferase involved in cell wall biosynthesis
LDNRITIGLTAYNSSEFIGESIQSLLTQTARDFIIIISDDASTDDTEHVCNTWLKKDSRITYFRQQNNLGPRANFEFVFQQCQTKYFMWASHDDIWSPNFVEECLAKLEQNPDAGFVLTRWIVESRKIPFIRRYFLANMKFVCDPDPIKRMLSFTSLPFVSFKDNMTYGVWRYSVLCQIIEDTNITSYFSIGGVANEYTLLKFRGCYIQSAYLRKRYKYFPPGSVFDKIVAFILIYLRQSNSKQLYPRYTDRDYINDLISVLKLANVDSKNIEKAVQLNLLHLPPIEKL